jgi:hypothetical protein
MSGDATFGGTSYQAGVIAFVSVHILLEQRLGWFELFDDTPTAVSGEVGGAGDDAAVEFGVGIPTIEIQAKHGLTGGAPLLEVLDRIRACPEREGESRPVVLAVDHSASAWLYETFANDLDRLRSGRTETCRAKTRDLLAGLGDAPETTAALRRVHIKMVDVDALDDLATKFAISGLQQVLIDSAQADVAWRVLRDDAAVMCRDRTRRARADFVQFLAARNIKVNPPPRIRSHQRPSRSLQKTPEPPQAATGARAHRGDRERTRGRQA